MRPEIERQERRNSYAPQAPVVVVPQIAPVREAPPEPKRLQPEKPVNAETGNKEGAIAAASPPPPQSPAPVAKTPADTACVGWWRICKFL